MTSRCHWPFSTPALPSHCSFDRRRKDAIEMSWHNSSLVRQPFSFSYLLPLPLFILIHSQVETNYPRPGSQALESLRIDGQFSQTPFQFSDDLLHVLTDSVGEGFLAQIIPNVLLRVQFRGVGRQTD